MKATVGPIVIGQIGSGDATRIGRMADRLGAPPEVLSLPELRVHARGAVVHPDGRGASWSHSPLPTDAPLDDIVANHDVVGIEHRAGQIILRGAQSGALPLYVEVNDDTVVFSSRLDALIGTRVHRPNPDITGLLEMVTASGPLGGRTTVTGISRLGPGDVLIREPSGEVSRDRQWPWPEIEPGGGTVTALSDVLRAELGTLASRHPLVSLLSGGWDSRLLLAAAFHTSDRHPIRALTTSSDTGTVMEELVAAQVAEHLALHHEVVMPRRDQFDADLRDFATAVDFQTAFHVWLVPLARALAIENCATDSGPLPTTLDGLGGGLFIGGAFADDDSSGAVAEKRLVGSLRYLPDAARVLRPAVVRQATDRIRADTEPVVRRYLDHPFGHTFTAYLTRTLPGISLAPHGLMPHVGNVATPFVNPRVVRTALTVPPAEHTDGRLYPQLLRSIDPVLAELPTAQEQVPWPRPHPRRITSREAVSVLRSLLRRDPVRELIAPRFLDAGPDHWRRVLATTGGQHLIRGLAVLSLWSETYDTLTTGLDLRELTR